MFRSTRSGGTRPSTSPTSTLVESLWQIHGEQYERFERGEESADAPLETKLAGIVIGHAPQCFASRKRNYSGECRCTPSVEALTEGGVTDSGRYWLNTKLLALAVIARVAFVDEDGRRISSSPFLKAYKVSVEQGIGTPKFDWPMAVEV